jgi:hypothetical protein
MRLGIQMIDTDGNVNRIKAAAQQYINQGDTATLYFQLVDLISGQRYVPSNVATVQVTIPRLTVVGATISNTRTTSDPSVSRAATKPFAGDWSIWSIPLSSLETSTLTSGGISVTVTDGASIMTAQHPLAISMVAAGAVQ